jgi:hypothetical protein
VASASVEKCCTQLSCCAWLGLHWPTSCLVQAHWRAHHCRQALRQQWAQQLRAVLSSEPDAGADTSSLVAPSSRTLSLFLRSFDPKDAAQLPLLAQVCQLVTNSRHANGALAFSSLQGEDLVHAALHVQRLSLAILQALLAHRCESCVCATLSAQQYMCPHCSGYPQILQGRIGVRCTHRLHPFVVMCATSRDLDNTLTTRSHLQAYKSSGAVRADDRTARQSSSMSNSDRMSDLCAPSRLNDVAVWRRQRQPYCWHRSVPGHTLSLCFAGCAACVGLASFTLCHAQPLCGRGRRLCALPCGR